VERSAFQRDLRAQDLALAAFEKAVQLVYERSLRPEEKRHAPGGRSRALAAGRGAASARAELDAPPVAAAGGTITRGGVTTAVARQFIEPTVLSDAPSAAHPRVVAHGAAAEQLPAFCELLPL